MGAGKDTMAQALMRQLRDKGKTVAIHRFSAPLKQMAGEYFGWDGTKGNELVTVNGNGYTGGRQLLQGLGRVFRAKVAPDYWIKELDKTLTFAESAGVDFVLVPDCRFFNEAYYIEQKGGYLIKVHRTGYAGDNDPSETEMDEPPFSCLVDAFIHNTTLDRLEQDAEAIADDLCA
jgi:hypothetical protein